jgi:hypothetical protein
MRTAQMIQSEKRFLRRLGIAFLILCILYGLFYMWENSPPKRPANVPSSAGYYGGWALPFTFSKRGDWVNCWFDGEKNVDRCRVTQVDGSFKYEGTYLPYQSHTPIPQNELLIDSDAMNRGQEQVNVGASIDDPSMSDYRVVPLVYLRDGEVLIPERAYKRGKEQLDEAQQLHSPSAPRPKPDSGR